VNAALLVPEHCIHALTHFRVTHSSGLRTHIANTSSARLKLNVDRYVAGELTPSTAVTINVMAPGARSEEAWLWHTTVCEAIQEVPRGKVTSYAHIARLVGKRERSICMIVTH
jgi:O6-methylguanine-DNA--protein-cysteine methyltransferase